MLELVSNADAGSWYPGNRVPYPACVVALLPTLPAACNHKGIHWVIEPDIVSSLSVKLLYVWFLSQISRFVWYEKDAAFPQRQSLSGVCSLRAPSWSLVSLSKSTL